MTTYRTGNPIGSTDPKDLYDNAENTDVFVNSLDREYWDDRFGRNRKTIHGMYQDFQEFLIKSGYVGLGPNGEIQDYAAGLEITERNQVFRYEGELYRAGAALDLPYTTTGDWATEGSLFVAVGDRALRQQLADPDVGSKLLSYKAPFYLSEPMSQFNKNSERISVHDAGVVGDGIKDDSDAIEKAMSWGVPLDFGKATILITRKIRIICQGNLNWTSEGARIINGSGSDIECMIDIELASGTDNTISGPLSIDGKFKTYLGIRFWNKSNSGLAGYVNSFSLSDITVENIRRSGNEFPNGDAIIIRGGFGLVNIDRPIVRNVFLAAGAGVVGLVGVSGISIYGDISGYPEIVNINEPYISEIKSEDSSYVHDQDGVRIFGPHATTVGTARNSTFSVIGGRFKNCYGRSIKSQATTGTVIGTNFQRTASDENRIGNQEIDFQTGGGVVSNIVCHYNGHVPSAVVCFQPDSERLSFGGSLSGCRVHVINAVLPRVAWTEPHESIQPLTKIEDVHVVGSVDNLIEYGVWGSNSSLSVNNVSVTEAIGGLIKVMGRGSGEKIANIFVSQARNISNIPCNLVVDGISGAAARSVVSAYSVFGFSTPNTEVYTSPNKGRIFRSASIGGMDRDTATTEFSTRYIPNSSNASFNRMRGLNTGVGMALISFGLNRNSQGIISFDSGGVYALAIGSSISVGGTSMPDTGQFRIWIEGEYIIVRNESGSDRYCSFSYFG